MATATADKAPLTTAKGELSESMALGGYAPALSPQMNNIIQPATADQVKPAQVAITDKDRLWLKELGLTTINTKDFSRGWSPNKERYRKVAWNESAAGRVAIRTFSRGLLGASFFAAGQTLVGSSRWGLAGYTDKDALSEQIGPMKFLAKTLDNTSGKLIKKAARVTAKIYSTLTGKTVNAENWAHSATTFRPTRLYNGYKGAYGRSLGDESMAITFDFSMASLGDYTGREIADVLDPNIKKTWMQNGHIDARLALKALGKSVFTGVTRAAGEDYFAMLFGYPYIIRASRNVLNHLSPGFAWDSDNALNGGSFKTSKIGAQHHVVGNYQLEGMADLGVRFTVYNWYTKIFRDMYDATLGGAVSWWKNGRHLSLPQMDSSTTPKTIATGTLHWVGDKLNYLARTVVKMTIIMVPTMPFFFLFRSSQSKDVGLAINIDKKDGAQYGIMGPVMAKVKDKDGTERFRPMFADGTLGKGRSDYSKPGVASFSVYSDNTPLFEKKSFESRTAQQVKDYEESTFRGFIGDKDSGYERRFNPYGHYVKWHDYITNPLGNISYKFGKMTTEILKPIGRTFGVSPANVARYSRKMTYAATAYTPYFAMKTDILTNALDTPRMNLAVDYALAGIWHMDLQKFVTGVNDIGHTILGQPFTNAKDEKEAQKQMHAFENTEPGEGEQNAARSHPIWTPPSKPNTASSPVKVFASDELKKKPITPLAASLPAVSTIKSRDASWKREEMLKKFDDSTIPQGHSLN